MWTTLSIAAQKHSFIRTMHILAFKQSLRSSVIYFYRQRYARPRTRVILLRHTKGVTLFWEYLH